MRVTTVSLLFIFSVALGQAQELPLLKRLEWLKTNGKHFRNLQPATDTTVALVRSTQRLPLNELQRGGFEILKQIDANTAIIRRGGASADFSESVSTEMKINSLWKLSEGLFNKIPDGTGRYIVRTSAPQKIIALCSGRAIARGPFVVLLEQSPANLSAILNDPAVSYIGYEAMTALEESQVLDLYLAPNKINKVQHDFPQLNGEGLVVSIKEKLYDPSDIDLLGKHVPTSTASTDTSTHATDMATIVAGLGNSFVTGRGVAMKANLTSSDFSNLFPDADAEYQSTQAWIQNHSYGTVVENFYGALAAAYDESCQRNPELLHVFSSGNAGTATAATGKYVAAPGFSNFTGNAKMAKNVLVVGSVDTTGHVIAFSSKGPTHDGRIKPDVMAYSTSGTSNSAALVSGIALLLQQEYKSQTARYPSSSLLKALLINGADDVGNPGPDYATGFGNVNAFRSFRMLQQERYLESEISSGVIKTFPIQVSPGAKNLKITLVWNDPAAPVDNSKSLVNDLDLKLTTDAGVIQPWVLDAAPTVTSLSAPATRGTDRINNVEQVSLANAAGRVTISVEANSLASATQKFSIAYHWDEPNVFTWLYPTGSDNFPYNGEAGTYFFWECSLPDEYGELQISSDNGQSWESLAQEVPLRNGSWRWEQPMRLNTAAIARMVVGGQEFRSDVFTISATLIPRVGFHCSDSSMLQWQSAENVSAYELYALTNSQFNAVAFTSDTLQVVNEKDGAFFAIQPKLANGRNLLRSPAVNVQTYGVDCFSGSLVDEMVDEEGTLLRLDLPTTYGIQAVTIEIVKERVFTPLVTLQPSETVRFLHENPPQGTNLYRARIALINGQDVFTDTLQVFNLTKTPFVIFPNPVSAGSDVNVFAGQQFLQVARFDLFKSDGSHVRSTLLMSDRDFVSTVGLPTGLYFFRITNEKGIFSGKILIR